MATCSPGEMTGLAQVLSSPKCCHGGRKNMRKLPMGRVVWYLYTRGADAIGRPSCSLVLVMINLGRGLPRDTGLSRVLVPRWSPPPPVSRRLANRGHSYGVPAMSTIITCSTIISLIHHKQSACQPPQSRPNHATKSKT
jgi:hypothetical protein